MSNKVSGNGRQRHKVTGTVQKVKKGEKKQVDNKANNGKALEKILGILSKKGK